MSRHWLERLALKQGLLAETTSSGNDAELDTVWTRVALSCGLDEADLAEVVADAHGVAAYDGRAPEASALKLVPHDWAIANLVLPLSQDDDSITVALSDPRDVMVQDELCFITARRVQAVVAPPSFLAEQLEAYFKPDNAAAKLVEGMSAGLTEITTDPEACLAATDVSAADVAAGPIVKLGNTIIAEAIRQGASDVHMAMEDDIGSVRFRVDGVLTRYTDLPAPVMRRAVARIKVIGGLDVADRLRPQDGRCRVLVEGKPYDLRISTVPTRGSEKAVIRVLDPGASPGLDSVGLLAEDLTDFHHLLRNREGIIFVTGPTGSGKTTTLYAVLQELATESVNIVTVEDPVEYELPGITQIQVASNQGVTFASALRAILRQDPDIVLVGEIRDLETAEIAVQASLTGHLVLATLHTNDAVGAIRRLTDLGLDRAAVAETLRGVIAQRLVRRLCEHCALPGLTPLPADEERLAEEYGVRPARSARGCAHCASTGHRGRAPVNEIITVNSELRELISNGSSASEIFDAALRAGTRPLLSAGLERARQGHTSLAEVDRVLGAGGSTEAGKSPVAEIVEPAVVEQPADTVAIATPPPDAADRAARVLVVDDDGVVRQLIRALLESAGFDVVEADDGIQAVRQLVRDNRFDLLVTDLDMPEMNGRSLLSHVRKDPGTANMPVIIATSSSDPAQEARLIENGADDYVRKPIDPARLLARVHATLRRAGHIRRAA